ncbi:hypothetical protein AB0I22_04885 [Streptomyces sp. NPDC050610]|uniref:hypothetical protein n=1 Tax=Streptomyces sp. NPDC050610 TaxID=3157097 RepID=UPI00344139FB
MKGYAGAAVGAVRAVRAPLSAARVTGRTGLASPEYKPIADMHGSSRRHWNRAAGHLVT